MLGGICLDTNLLVWVALVLLIVLVLGRGSKKQEEPYPWLYVVFFLSGFPALIYQIVWQRALFAVYGVNIESVTIVVTAFMLGLGLGSLFGGQLSRSTRLPLLAIFGCVELGIAAYGLASLRLFHWVAQFTAGSSLFKTSIVTLLLVLIPTMLMGCTLPLLVAHMVRVSRSVGRSVGRLYFVNTLGSAIACFIAANITMKHLGQSGSVLLAAIVNVGIGTAVLSLYLYSRR
jgi:spermidine synthase